MKVFRGFNHPGIAQACALTIGNFDGVHRGHQAMLALLKSEAQQRGVPSQGAGREIHSILAIFQKWPSSNCWSNWAIKSKKAHLTIAPTYAGPVDLECDLLVLGARLDVVEIESEFLRDDD